MLIKKEYKNIPLDELESMADYQRPINHTFIEEKSKPGIFDKDAVECPKISVRNDGTIITNYHVTARTAEAVKRLSLESGMTEGQVIDKIVRSHLAVEELDLLLK